MQSHHRALFFALALSGVLTSCSPAIYSVGGTLPSVNGGKGMEKAQISLFGNSCAGLENSTGTVTYHDKSVFNPNGKGAGLQFTSTTVLVSDCSNPATGEEYELCHESELLNTCGQFGSTAPIKWFAAEYYSTNKVIPGSGVVFGCVQDNGQGKKATFKDKAFLLVDSGPYAGYVNLGDVQGNVQTYPCP